MPALQPPNTETKKNLFWGINANDTNDAEVNGVWSELFQEHHDSRSTWQEKLTFIKAETTLQKKLKNWKNRSGLNKRALDFLVGRVEAVLDETQVKKIGKFATMDERVFDKTLAKTKTNPH